MNNAMDNLRFLGLHLLGVQPQDKPDGIINTKLDSSSTSLGSHAEFKLRENGATTGQTRPSSEAGTETSWSIIDKRWVVTRTQSDPGGPSQT